MKQKFLNFEMPVQHKYLKIYLSSKILRKNVFLLYLEPVKHVTIKCWFFNTYLLIDSDC